METSVNLNCEENLSILVAEGRDPLQKENDQSSLTGRMRSDFLDETSLYDESVLTIDITVTQIMSNT